MEVFRIFVTGSSPLCHLQKHLSIFLIEIPFSPTFHPLFTVRAKNSHSSSFQEEAREQYVGIISSLTASEQPEKKGTQPVNDMSSYQTLLVTTKDKITTITLNRPQKKNAITVEVRFILLNVITLIYCSVRFMVYFLHTLKVARLSTA